MKKYILSLFITLSFVCVVPSFTNATEKNLSNSDIRAIVNVLISIGAIPQDKVSTVNVLLALLSGDTVVNPAPSTQSTSTVVQIPVIVPVSNPVITTNNNITPSITLVPLSGGSPVNNSSTNPYLGTGSANSQFVSEGTASIIAYYNFVAFYGPAVIKEMYFTTTGSSVSNGDAPITSVIVGGVSVPVVGNSATLTGLNDTVPVGNAGYNIPVAVTFAKVGLGGVASNKTAGLILTGYRYTSGITDNVVNNLSASTNLFTIVGSKPTLSISNPTSAKVGPGGVVEVAKVTVSADSAGPIKVNEIPLSMITTGNGSVSALSLKVGGSNIALSSGGAVSVGTSTATTSLVIDGGYEISAGSSVTFSIYADTSLSQQNSTPDTLRTSFGASFDFVWTDVNGGAQVTGEMIYNFPSNSAIVSY